jgi:hypothetical protein
MGCHQIDSVMIFFQMNMLPMQVILLVVQDGGISPKKYYS